MENIYNIFESLSERQLTDKEDIGIETSSIPGVRNHKIGISKEGYPIFFIKCSDRGIPASQINLKTITIHLQINCELYTNGVLVDKGIYTQVIFKGESWELKKYFIDIFSTFILTLLEIEKGEKVKNELNKIVNIFSKLSNTPENSIQGLWAELLLIKISSNPKYLIDSWHIKKTDKYDFNDGIDKIEVKSTEKIKREHHFSLEQLITTSNSKLIIASFKTYETGKGTSVFDLSDSIKYRINDPEAILKLNTLISESLGNSFEIAFEKYYDLEYGIENLQFYNSYDVPTIKNDTFPKSVSQINFVADLSEIEAITKIEYKSLLHELLNVSTIK
jgi:hypothetical protein